MPRRTDIESGTADPRITAKRLSPEARRSVRNLPGSKVREIANAGFGRADILRFWFGESTQPTPDFIKRAAVSAINADQTFYAHNNGRADLRQEIANYLGSLHGRRLQTSEVSVTSSGVSALSIAMQAILEPGDEVVVVTPVWPNVTAIPQILSANVVRIGLEPRNDRWALDLDRFLDAITPKTRLAIINSPGNPTGWMLPAGSRQTILDHCRHLGVWLLVDDVYERLVFESGLDCAPSFLSIADAEDRLIGANSFSKAWLMTGWRLGWLVAPPSLEADLGKLIEFNTSCAPDFVQIAGREAIRHGDAQVKQLRRDLLGQRDLIISELSRIPGIEAPKPDGAMYAFFRISGHDNSVALARRLLQEAGLGLAPGAAFGPEGEGWLRWCFAADSASIREGLQRLKTWLEKQN